MHLLPINDLAVINAVLSHSAVKDDVSDDYSSDKQFSELPQNTKWLAVMHENQIHGIYALVPMNAVTVEIHTCLLPSMRGKDALCVANLLMQHIFTSYQKAISHIPEYNKKAKLYALRVGFQIEGINRSSFLKNGKLLDQYLVGMTREEFLCR